MLGIIGSEERMQGAVVADSVNLVARLEEVIETKSNALMVEAGFDPDAVRQ